MPALILVLPLTLVGAGSEHAARAKRKNFTKTSTVAQADQNAMVAEDFLITDPARPFIFQKAGKIRKLTNLTVTLMLEDVDTTPGNVDENELTLALDGIDTQKKR